MEMVRNQRPGQAGGLGFLQKFGKAFRETIAVIVVPKDRSAFNPPDNEMLQGLRHVNPGFSRHAHRSTNLPPCKLQIYKYEEGPLFPHFLYRFRTYKNTTWIRIPGVIPFADACLRPKKKIPKKEEINALISGLKKVLNTGL